MLIIICCFLKLNKTFFSEEAPTVVEENADSEGAHEDFEVDEGKTC